MKQKNASIQDNYRRVNQISAKCMRLVCLVIVMASVYSYFIGNIETSILVIAMSLSLIVALVPTLVINVFKVDSSPATKYVVIVCTCLICLISLTVFSAHAFPIIIFPILMASLYHNQTLVLFTSLLVSLGIFSSNYLNFRFSDFLVDSHYNEMYDVLLYYTIPHIVIVFFVSIVAYFIVQRNAMMINTAIDTADIMKANEKGLISAFAEISENKSKFTGEHIKRVAEYMRVLGRASGFDEEYLEDLCTASMMHDIGKLMISEEILDKPDKLTDEEFMVMKSHVIYGESLLEKCPGKMMNLAKTLAKEHHERWDGSGYLGMKGEEISYISRLMAVCDVFDALTSDRYYKKGWSLEETFNEIVRLSGKHFDPQVVKLFIRHFDEFKAIHDAIPDKTIY